MRLETEMGERSLQVTGHQGFLGTPSLRETHGTESPCRPQRECGPAGNLVLDFRPPESISP